MKCWWICLLMVTSASGQVMYDSYTMSIASADVCSSRGTYLGRNPGSIAEQENVMIGVSQLMPFGISGLRTNTLYVSGKVNKQGYSFDYSQQGIEGYKEHLASLTAGMKLNQNLSLGVKIVSAIVLIREETIQKNYRVELGIVERFSNKLSAGIHLKLRTNKAIVVFQNTALSMGLCYLLDSKLPFYVSIEMSELGPTRIRAGMEYLIGKALAVRIGWNNKDAALSSGLNYRFKKYNIEMSTNYHNRLGLSYGVGMGIQFID
jgi:hypothetical protein